MAKNKIKMNFLYMLQADFISYIGELENKLFLEVPSNSLTKLTLVDRFKSVNPNRLLICMLR
jgi:hypothetical protein